MKLLVATQRTLGARRNDFFHTKDSELVTFPVEDHDDEPIDGHCGCHRSFVGLTTRKATTMAECREVEISEDRLRVLVTLSLKKAGYLYPEIAEELVEATIAEMKQNGDKFPVGSIVERRGDRLRVRDEKRLVA